MQNIIIGTAGHIDHGKTTLVKALTGRSTDKLQEEIKRGISINLGFTYFDLPSGGRVGIVDVPGHERFIKNMLAGAAGIDVVLLTIAANEGVMPQTVEHADILSFLDIKESLIVLTKCDMADETMIELVKDEARERFCTPPFAGAEIIEVDSISGRGLDTLVRRLDDASRRIKARNDRAAARLNIDRVFSLKGFGTIVTGTLAEGRISAGDELAIYPRGIKAKIRSVQVHDTNIETARAGQRTALNIPNVKRDEIQRGDILAHPGTMVPTNILDVKLKLLSHSNITLKLWDRVRVYLGAAEVLARVVPLDCDRIEPGGEAFCQLRLENTAAAKKGDKFVIRMFSPLETIGGGAVLDANPKKHGKADKKTLEILRQVESGGEDAHIEEFIKAEGGCSLKDICARAGADEQNAAETAERLIASGSVLKINKSYIHIDTVAAFNEASLSFLSAHHEKYPLKSGMLKEELKSRLSELGAKEFDSLLKMLESENEIKIIDNGIVRLSGFKIAYTPAQAKIKELIERKLDEAGFAPPAKEALSQNMPKGFAAVLESLIGESVVMLDAQTAISKAYYDKATELLLEHLKKHQKITLAEFRDLTGSSRKYAMLLLDSFDKRGVTMRVEDWRVLRKQ